MVTKAYPDDRRPQGVVESDFADNIMFNLMRRRRGQAILVTLTTAMMLFLAAAPCLHAIVPTDRNLSTEWLRQRLHLQDEHVVEAVEAALKTSPASLDELVAAVLLEMDGSDDLATRRALLLVLPAMSLERILSGGWLVEFRHAVKLARAHTLRLLPDILSASAKRMQSASAYLLPGSSIRLAVGPNFTGWQIRHLITSVPLGP